MASGVVTSRSCPHLYYGTRTRNAFGPFSCTWLSCRLWRCRVAALKPTKPVRVARGTYTDTPTHRHTHTPIYSVKQNLHICCWQRTKICNTFYAGRSKLGTGPVRRVREISNSGVIINFDVSLLLFRLLARLFSACKQTYLLAMI